MAKIVVDDTSYSPEVRGEAAKIVRDLDSFVGDHLSLMEKNQIHEYFLRKLEEFERKVRVDMLLSKVA